MDTHVRDRFTYKEEDLLYRFWRECNTSLQKRLEGKLLHRWFVLYSCVVMYSLSHEGRPIDAVFVIAEAR